MKPFSIITLLALQFIVSAADENAGSSGDDNYTTANGCKSDPTWIDNVGNTCEQWEEYGWCDFMHNGISMPDLYPAIDGRTANHACCSCGGGLLCTNKPWQAVVGSAIWDCYTFESDPAACYIHGDVYDEYNNNGRGNGFSANEACCVCKGGQRTYVGDDDFGGSLINLSE